MTKSFAVLMMVGVLAMISFAQTTTKTNLYNVNGTKVEITTKSYVQTFFLLPSGELQFSNKTKVGHVRSRKISCLDKVLLQRSGWSFVLF